MTALDPFLPNYDDRAGYSVEVRASADSAVAALLASPCAPDRLVATLLRLRGLETSATVEELLVSIGFGVLYRAPTEVVFGAAGRPWTKRGGIHAFEAAQPGDLRVVVDMRAVPLDAGRCLLSTETRVQATNETARRAFARYWRVVKPFSGLIRRRWLRAAASVAQGS